jgi:hypothetical protein
MQHYVLRRFEIQITVKWGDSLLSSVIVRTIHSPLLGVLKTHSARQGSVLIEGKKLKLSLCLTN